MSFLTNENGQFILELLHRFLMDTYQFKLQNVMNEQQIRKLLETTMISVYKKNDKHTSVEQLNKMTIVELKEYIKQTYIHKPEEPVPIPLSEDSDFTNKVQMLEFQRKNFQVPQVPQVVPPTISPVIQTPIPSSISTIYMPMPPKIGKEILIVSMIRDWHKFNDISHFEWNGPFHHTSDSLTRVIGIIGNLDVESLRLQVQGASGESEMVTLIFDGYMYRPLLNTLGYIKRLSLPWKISLMSLYGGPLMLDKAYRYTYEKIQNGTILSIGIHSFKQGVNVYLALDNHSYKKVMLVGVDERRVWIQEDIAMEGYLFKNEFTICLEMTTSDHRPITKS